MTRQALKACVALVLLVLLVAAFGIGGYSGYLLGRHMQSQDSLYCTAGHTRTYVHLLEDLRSNEIPMAVGLIETNIDAGVLLLTSAPEKFTGDHADAVNKTLTVVRDYRRKHPWMGSSTELRQRVNRALANVR